MIGSLTSPLIKDVTTPLIVTPEGIVLQYQLDAKVDASLITTDFPLLTGSLNQWLPQVDLGSFGPTIQTVAVSKPTVGTTFGEQAVVFAADFMDIPFTLDWTNQAFTIVIVTTKFGGVGLKGLIGNNFGPNAANFWNINQAGNNVFTVSRTGGNQQLNYLGLIRNLPPQIIEFNHNPATSTDETYRNGVFADSEPSVVNIGGLTNQLRMGRFATLFNPWDGTAMQLDIYKGLFTDSERASNNAELNLKWQQ